jgi:hypothetical protein
MNNEVTNFMYYMFNRWSLAESRYIYGASLGEHIWEKWNEVARFGNGDQLCFYASLDNDCKQKLVDRANELYNK